MVQAMPSGDVITRLPVPEVATATKRLLPKVTLFQLLSTIETRLVHTMPSGEVITRFPVPEVATATKRLFPKVTPYHTLSAAEVWLVHIIPAWYWPGGHFEQAPAPDE